MTKTSKGCFHYYEWLKYIVLQVVSLYQTIYISVQLLFF